MGVNMNVVTLHLVHHPAMASFLVLLSVSILASLATADPCPFSDVCQCIKNWEDPANVYVHVKCDAKSGIPTFTGDHEYTVKERLVLNGTVDKIPAKAFTAFKSIKTLVLEQKGEAVQMKFDDEAFSDTFIQQLSTVKLLGLIPPPQAVKKLGQNGLRVLDISTGGLDIKLDANTFADFKHLSVLKIVETVIKQIDDAAFGGLENNLHGLTLKYNMLPKLPRNAIKNLVNLEALDLSQNLIDDFQIGDFSPFKKLIRLALNLNNGKKAINSGSLNNLPQSTIMIELNESGLTAIPREMLASNPQITQIQMNDNHISQVNSGDFDKNANLQYLYLDGNPITSIQNGALKQLKKLEILSLKNTQLTTFDLSMCNDMNRVTVDLSHGVNLKSVDASAMDQPADQHGISLLYLIGTSIEKLDMKLDEKINTVYFNSLFFMNNTMIICDNDVHWVAKHTFCQPSRLAIDGSTCAQTGQSLEEYLKENVPNPCQSLPIHPRQVRKV